MAYSYVGSLGSNSVQGGPGTSLALAVPAGTVPAGDYVAVWFAFLHTGGSVTCADSQGNSYTQLVDQPNASGLRVVILLSRLTTPLTGAGGDQITLTFPSSSEPRLMSVSRFSVNDNKDSQLVATAGTTGNSTSPDSGAAALYGGNLALGAVAMKASGVVFTPGAGWSPEASVVQPAAGPYSAGTLFPLYQITGGSGNVDAAGTLGSAQQWTAAVAGSMEVSPPTNISGTSASASATPKARLTSLHSLRGSSLSASQTPQATLKQTQALKGFGPSTSATPRATLTSSGLVGRSASTSATPKARLTSLHRLAGHSASSSATPKARLTTIHALKVHGGVSRSQSGSRQRNGRMAHLTVTPGVSTEGGFDP